MRDTALEDLLECHLEISRDGDQLASVIGEAKELVRRRPLRERGHVLLIRALTSADRAGEASVAFEQAAAEFRAASGLDPGKELTLMYGRCLQRDPAVLPAGMRRVVLLDPAHRQGMLASADESRLAQVEQARSAMVDIGARFVTVCVSDASARPEVATRLIGALDPDMATGVVEIRQASLPPEHTAEQVLATALTDAEPGNQLERLLVVLLADDSQWAHKEAQRILALPDGPFLLLVAPVGTGLPGEYEVRVT
jgi:hypothetical protein